MRSAQVLVVSPHFDDFVGVAIGVDYAGPKLKGRLEKIGKWIIQIVKRSDNAEGFELLPRRWVVERTFAWLGRCRRLAKDVKATIASATAWLLLAHIRLLTRKITRQS